MTCLLNEEIKAIQLYMSHLEKAIPLEVDTGKKQKMKESYNELGEILKGKLNQCGDYVG